MSGLESTASRVLAPDFYAEMGFSTLWHTQRKCVRICWVSINFFFFFFFFVTKENDFISCACVSRMT